MHKDAVGLETERAKGHPSAQYPPGGAHRRRVVPDREPVGHVTRLARERDTHLTATEIAAEALRCFDEGTSAPSIRQLAAVLKVTPSAVYHHYRSRAEIIQAAVDLVWQEAIERFLEVVPDPFTAPPEDVLIIAGITTRRTFGDHYRVAPFIAATPQSNQTLADILALMAQVFERLGLDDEEAAASFHTYASYTIGAVLFGATRRITNEQLARDEKGAGAERFRSVTGRPDGTGTSVPAIQRALDGIMDLSMVDPDRDEELFADGLRRLIKSFPRARHAGGS